MFKEWFVWTIVLTMFAIALMGGYFLDKPKFADEYEWEKPVKWGKCQYYKGYNACFVQRGQDIMTIACDEIKNNPKGCR